MTEQLEPVGHKPGSLVRQITPAGVEISIDQTKTEIRAALSGGELDLALVLISRHAGLRLIRGILSKGD